jgi:shikimate dehydrogenase
VEFAGVHPDTVVSDIVYVPLETAFLAAARRRGLVTVDGLGMLLHQAVPGFEKWFGTRPTVTDDLYRLVRADIERPA